MLAQPCSLTSLFRAPMSNALPEPRSVVRLEKMHQFVDYHVIQHLGRRHNEPPVEVEITQRRAATPTRSLILYSDTLVMNLHRFCPARHACTDYPPCLVSHPFTEDPQCFALRALRRLDGDRVIDCAERNALFDPEAHLKSEISPSKHHGIAGTEWRYGLYRHHSIELLSDPPRMWREDAGRIRQWLREWHYDPNASLRANNQAGQPGPPAADDAVGNFSAAQAERAHFIRRRCIHDSPLQEPDRGLIALRTAGRQV